MCELCSMLTKRRLASDSYDQQAPSYSLTPCDDFQVLLAAMQAQDAERGAGPGAGNDPMAAQVVAVVEPIDPGDPFEATVVGSIPNSGDQNINALIYGTRWSGAITFDFPDAFADYGTYPHTISGFYQVPLHQRTAVRFILQGETGLVTEGPTFGYGAFDNVANMTFSHPNSFNAADISVAGTNLFNGANLGTARVADFPELDQRVSGGDVWFGDDGGQYLAPLVGSYAWHTHIHELGHALGLKHGHDAGYGVFGQAMTADRDSMEFSVMTYRSYVNDPLIGGYSNEGFGYAQTLMMYDIRALQYLYGANYSTNSGNTVYTWSPTTGEMFLNGAGQGAPGNGAGGTSNRVFLTVWDGGGTDTYDMSNYSNAVNIDLRPGFWSITSNTQRANLGDGNTARGTVFNALMVGSNTESLIENAIGGAFADTFRGNVANNVLTGNGGVDTVIFEGNRSSFTFVESNSFSYTATGGGQGTDTLNSIERFQFNDVTVTDDFMGGVSTPASIAVNGSVSGNIQFNGDRDWFRVDLTAGHNYVIYQQGSPTSHGTLTDPLVRLYNAVGVQIGSNDDGGFGFESQLGVRVTTTGTYYVAAARFGDSNVGTYTLTVDETDATRFEFRELKFAGFGTSVGAGGWSSQVQYPRRVADVNGDGLADVIGFGSDGVYVSTSIPNNLPEASFNSTVKVHNAFGIAGGWTSDDTHPRFMRDVNADGRADIVGFGASGVYVALNTGGVAFGSGVLELASFGLDGGWSNNTTYRREVADVTGDGLADIVGFAGNGVFIATGAGGGDFNPMTFVYGGFGVLAEVGGWVDDNLYPRRLIDVNGDGRNDIVGFGDAGVYVALATGTGATASFGPTFLALASFGAGVSGGGWTSNNIYTRVLGDINADGRGDIVGFGSSGVYYALGQADGTFGAAVVDLAYYGAAPSGGSWNNDAVFPRLLGDITGDGRADIVAFGDPGILISRGFDFLVV